MFSLGAASIIAKYIKHKFLERSDITEAELTPILREIRIALLNSDVNLRVIKDFLAEIKEDLLVKKNYNPGEKVDVVAFATIKKKLIKILGNNSSDLLHIPNRLNKILVVGLNGAGKTTTTAKLANLVKKKYSLNVKTVSLDVYRPGAYQQLKQLSDSINIPCIETPSKDKFREVIKEQITLSEKDDTKYIFFDNYGLLSDNEALLEETEQIKKLINPTEVIFVIDALAGQEILDVVRVFHEKLKISGLVVSKTDANTPMGGVFSIAYLLNIPIKYMGKGENIEDLVKFYPDRIASVILGEGDILSLAEKIEESVDSNSTQRMFSRLMRGQFDLNDLVTQIKEVRKIGSLKNLFNMIPGMPIAKFRDDTDLMEKQLRTWEIIISSMTLKERKNPKLFKKQPNRKIRVIKGSGKKPDELNKLLKRWEESKKKIDEMVTSFKKGKNPLSLLG